MKILEHDGQPAFVILPYDEYLAIQEKLEDLDDVEAYRKARVALERGDDELLPHEMVERLLNENPVRVWREHRGLKQKELAARVSVTTSMLSQIESGNKQGSLETLKQIAAALRVDLDDLT